MRKYLYTTLLLALLAQEGVMAQENEGKKGGFFGKIKDTFSTEINIFCFYVSIHHLNLTISKYSIIDFQITKVGTEFKIFEVAV